MVSVVAAFTGSEPRTGHCTARLVAARDEQNGGRELLSLPGSEGAGTPGVDVTPSVHRLLAPR